MLSGDNSILTKAVEAKDRTEFGKAKETVALALAEAVANKYTGNSAQALEVQVISKLQEAGYTIGSENTGTIQGINLSSSSVTIEEGGNTAEVTATLNTTGGSTNYVLINGLYYPLIKTNGDITLGETGKAELTDSNVTLADITLAETGSINASLNTSTGKVTIETTNVTADENSDKVELKYNNTTYGTINVAVKKVSLAEISPATATAEVGGTTTLSVTLADYQNGTITWSVSSGGSYASVPANSTGTSVQVTGDAVGTAKIRATYTAGTASTSVERDVNVVTEISVIGDYVNYNVPYTDMYSDTDTETEGLQGYNFTASDGWRILERKKNATDSSKYDLKIISTGVPAKLFYYYNPSSTETENNNWWGTTAQVNSTYGLELSSWSSSYSGYYAAYGLTNNFTSIIFDNGTSQSTANKGCWQSVAGKTNGTGADFIASGYNNISVHNLTYEDLCTARRQQDTSIIADVKTNHEGDTGLFMLRNLATENSDFCYTSSISCSYWLGTVAKGFTSSMYSLLSDGVFNGYLNNYTSGLRPVIEILGVTMTQNPSTGVWTITQ